MKNRQEAQMQEMMNSATLEELMPGFDQEALWAEVARKLPEQQPGRRIPLRPIAWAAAVAALIFLSWMGYRFSGRQEAATAPSVARATGTLPPHATIPAASHNSLSTPGIVAAPVRKDAVVATHVPAALKTPVPATAPENITQPEPAPAQQEAAAPAEWAQQDAPPAKKVVHYLDLDDDDVPATAVAASAPQPLIRVKPNQYPIAERAAAQKPPFRDFVLALGNP